MTQAEWDSEFASATLANNCERACQLAGIAKEEGWADRWEAACQWHLDHCSDQAPCPACADYDPNN